LGFGFDKFDLQTRDYLKNEVNIGGG